MRLSLITIHGFKSFAKKTTIDVTHNVTGVVGPNGSGKSNIAESIRFVLGEQSMKSMRGKIGSDVIFKGSQHLSALSRASVIMTIDNRDYKKTDGEQGRKTDLSHVSDSLAPYLVYDELVLARTIYADGTSEYTLNDAKVRLKDVQELLSFAGIGGSAHTIINQGEADRILLASPKDRKEALEDALGLRVYHIRLQESSKKLEKVKTHVREVELLRTEIKPHLSHLERQVKKIESQEEEKKNLFALLVAYFQKEDGELALLRERIYEQGTSTSLQVVVASIEKELVVLHEKTKSNNASVVTEDTTEKDRIMSELRLCNERKDQVIKTLGRLEGEKKALEKELSLEKEATSVTRLIAEVKEEERIITGHISLLFDSLSHNDVPTAITYTDALSEDVKHFFTKHTHTSLDKKESVLEALEKITQALREHDMVLADIAFELGKLQESLSILSSNREVTIITHHEEEKKIMLLESKLRELKSTILLRKQEENELQLRTEHCQSLTVEGVSILGRGILDYVSVSPEEKYRTMKKQDLMRSIERSKLRIEEAGVVNKDEVVHEYVTTKERDEYLAKELADIHESEEKLLLLIKELEDTLSVRFSSGVEQVSQIFSTFFGEVFVGGKAKLSLVKQVKVDEEGNQTEEVGIDLDVSLPNKKVKELTMFSGGERTLVSIALLFAMSSITPPPFMVLDETDAPLDESNARKYGAMLKRLSENSKLLVITHNRETMNHCDMLYGVTVGVDGGSKLLSIDFKQAEKMVA